MVQDLEDKEEQPTRVNVSRDKLLEKTSEVNERSENLPDAAYIERLADSFDSLRISIDQAVEAYKMLPSEHQLDDLIGSANVLAEALSQAK